LDGFVDRYFNRKVSAALTRLFLRVGLSPNAITVVATLIGLLAAACFAVGSYGAGVLGALLFQLSAVVDCCDGEVARLTFRESSLGERLDILTDNLVHIAIFAGITWGVFLGHRAGMAEWGGLNALAVPVPWLPLALGGAAILGNGISLWLVDRARSHRGRGIWTDPAQAARTDFILKNVASRDFSVAVLLFAVLDLLPWFLWLAAIGVNVFWIITAWVSRPATTARA
jgi:phosphatidylglycerophosphate synthase